MVQNRCFWVQAATTTMKEALWPFLLSKMGHVLSISKILGWQRNALQARTEED